MKNNASRPPEIPSLEQLEGERKRIKRSRYYMQALRGTLSVLIVVAAIAVLVATLFLPILQISGDSMKPTLSDGEITVMFKTKSFERGDLIGFYYQGKILLKRVIGTPDDEVSIDADGNVYVNGELLDEPYTNEKCLGDCDVEFPYTVPQESYFVLGDHRLNSVDSRNTAIGAVKNDMIIGKVFLRVWPLDAFEWMG